jgi:arabinogalactan endo-1,4-beta-galactosidase
VEIMIHLDRGGDAEGAVRFLDRLLAQGVAFDLIGLSYYPWWHGTLDDLRHTLNTLAARYGKPLIVVETAYPWTLGWYDDTRNLVGLESQLHPGFPATVSGQGRFLAELVRVVRETRSGLGRGVYYWSPEAIPVSGAGSAMENLALFDPRGELLESIVAWERASKP